MPRVTLGLCVDAHEAHVIRAAAVARGLTVSSLLHELVRPILEAQPPRPDVIVPDGPVSPLPSRMRSTSGSVTAEQLTGILMGDPPSGRSALDRRKS